MVEAGFNELLHHPSRLAVLAFLSGCIEADFALVRDRCELSDSALSKIARTLEEAGYIDVRKGRLGRRARTWLALTPVGGDALAAHLDALQAAASAASSSSNSLDRPFCDTGIDFTSAPSTLSPATASDTPPAASIR
ncbi:transcriptional regulator [Actinacidiphila oryziradicis]|uniref:Transcriptional regulator n=1 Tax=Actinacidiphila oryziradicis TaxID=2571141 RepID=A0A4U0RUG7_9ACTN|nr:transcriptional regulator [Actinacidiphila oryziradicis]